jgi:hypothetical protein
VDEFIFELFPTDGVAIPRIKTRPTNFVAIVSIRGPATPSVGSFLGCSCEAIRAQLRLRRTATVIADVAGNKAMRRHV